MLELILGPGWLTVKMACKVDVLIQILYMSHLVGKPTWFPNRSDTNQAAQSQKRARSLKFWI